ncbi:ABC transporter ATP-binding protein [uncultured Clostridium sp.]|uniref:ABC transporter ATP-binding protein n=1 Tax=uncultured Clostridium sp. TaxID=59620 RepID=UPI00258836C4|nr:ABC transporter ATP-binding protein [uncultured Clostridium sp.]
MSVSIKARDIIKKYGDNIVIPNLNLDINNGEFFTLLGPSGCGKTTFLRMIAGFNTIEGGEISFEDKVINDIPAHKRNIGMVFQNYAIFPHLTVKQNVEYGLKLRNLSKKEMENKVSDILKVVKIDDYKDRLPERLSGGQQQRVALARAIVIHPSVLLMDEPLSNLDAKLRVEMRGAIREVQKEVGITTVYVTHDQEEALAISDRIAVMKDGVVQHVGTPKEIYTRPKNTFVSTFIGHSNLFKGTIEIKERETFVKFEKGYAVKMENLKDNIKDGEKVIIAVRPEEFLISNKGLETKIKTATFLGRYTNYEIVFNSDEILEGQAAIELSQDIGSAERIYDEGDSLFLEVNPKKINVFTENGEENLIKGSEN